MSKRTGNRDGVAAKKRRKRHRMRVSRSWRARHLVIEQPDGSFAAWDLAKLKDAMRHQYAWAMDTSASPWREYVALLCEAEAFKPQPLGLVLRKPPL